MLPLVFIGGAVTGAAGLLAAVMYDNHKSESAYSPLLNTPEHLDAEEVTRQLNAYFFKASSLHLKCSQIIGDSSHLIFTSVPLLTDGFLERAVNAFGDGMTGISRRLRQDDLVTLKKDCQRLYDRFHGIFQRANTILQERGKSPVSLKSITFKGVDFSIDNSVENEDWWEDFSALTDKIQNFLDTSCKIAEQLVEMLKQEDDPAAIGEQAHD